MDKAENEASPETATNWSVSGAAAVAVAASVCCVLPVVLVSLGITGAWIGSLSALAPFKPYFIGASLLLLGYAGYREYRMAARPDCACDTIVSNKTRRIVLGGATMLTLGLLGSTLLVSAPATSTPQATQAAPATTTPALEEVVLEVEGMTCSGCTTTVRSSLQQVDGVQQVTVTYEPPEARVMYDPSTVTPRELARAPTEVGYSAKVKQESSSGRTVLQ
jgi:copper chaperone CopZ